ncbi:MAG: PEGA domain-containing protein [Spirochaetales bacterium]|nr:PEGA domain-containing protein [Spirochaetales bacterium]
MKKNLLFLLLALLVVPAFAIDNPRIAVVPFNAIGVSENDAQVLTGLFETALVKTDSFFVIEQNQVKEIIDAQAYSMSGCTDEACAIEFGELLAAEQIILGDLSVIGGKYILNAKIIDVAQGSNVKADNVEAANMADMTKATELLAFKLAGLTFSSGSNVRIAEDFGEVLIETVPSGADIYINGAKKGVSPDLISRIPIGTIRIEAKKGNLYGVKDVTISAETGRISLSLEEMYGNLFIKSSSRNVDVYLDGRKLGPLGTGFFERIAVGNHKVELRGSDSLWKGDIEVENGVSTKIDAYPRPYGTITYQLPNGVRADLTSREESYSVRGNGRLNLWAGSYSISVVGGRYETYKEEIDISKGRTTNFSPALKTVRALEEKYFTSRYDAAELKLGNASESPVMSKMVIDEIELLQRDLRASQHDFPKLNTDLGDLHGSAYMQYKFLLNLERLTELEGQRAGVQASYDLVAGERAANDTLGWLCLGAGGAGLITSGISYFMAVAAFTEYTETTDPTVALAKRTEVQQLDITFLVAGGVGIVFTVLSPLAFNSGPDVSPMIESMNALDLEIAELRARTVK